MAEGKRPGGLTALAVLNFVFAGLGVFFLLGVWALTTAVPTEVAEAADAADVIPTGMIYIALILGLISVILLIISGIGYIGQKRVIGKVLGNVYAILSIAQSVFGIVALKAGFGAGTIIGLIYPVLTLALLNTVFKDDFPN